jgi:hypothetical protein
MGWLHMMDETRLWSCMIPDWTEAGSGRTGRMHDWRLWNSNGKGGMTCQDMFSFSFFQRSIKRGVYRKQWERIIRWQGWEPLFCSILTGMDSAAKKEKTLVRGKSYLHL